MAAKIPATVVTGFLGAGKTTLIRHLLENANGSRLAIVVNEFGDVGVDGALLAECGIPGCGEGDVIELANGCICCTVADDFLPTIEALLARAEPPDHIVIETSGLALPKPLVRAFAWPEVRTRVTVDGVIAVIDGPAAASGLFAADPARIDEQRRADPNLDHDTPLAELFADQIACADLIVVNKADLMDRTDSADAAIAPLRRAGTGLVRTSGGRLDPAVALGIGAAAEDDLAARPSHHDDEDDHDHDEFESFVVELGAVAEPEALARRIGDAARDFAVLRVKGFAEVTGRDMRLVVQGVGARVQHYYDREWRNDETRGTRLVVIGEAGLDRDGIRAAIAR